MAEILTEQQVEEECKTIYDAIQRRRIQPDGEEAMDRLHDSHEALHKKVKRLRELLKRAEWFLANEGIASDEFQKEVKAALREGE